MSEPIHPRDLDRKKLVIALDSLRTAKSLIKEQFGNNDEVNAMTIGIAISNLDMAIALIDLYECDHHNI